MRAEFFNKDSLVKAFNEANTIFAYTDFASAMMPPSAMNRMRSGEKLPVPICQVGAEVEFKQEKNIADAAASIPGLRRLFYWRALPPCEQLI